VESSYDPFRTWAVRRTVSFDHLVGGARRRLDNGERRPSTAAAHRLMKKPRGLHGASFLDPCLRSRKEDLPRVPRDRGNADELLRTFEQRSKLPTGSLGGDFLRAICPCYCAADHVRGLLIAIDAIDVRFGSRIDKRFDISPPRHAAGILNLNLNLNRISAVCRESLVLRGDEGLIIRLR
jgi:hypothetical protein